MNWYKKALNQPSYPNAGAVVSGLTVRDDIPNLSSISSSLTDYRVIKWICEVPMSEFDGPKSVFYAADDFEHSRKLAELIKESREISPLIVVVEKEGPYILEGAHRYVALHYLGAKSFPAVIVIDENDSVDEKEVEEVD